MDFTLKIFFVFGGILLAVGKSLSQVELPDVIPPSPTAASLGEYGDIPVSQYTGIPNISIPLYALQSRDISLPISLNYHAGGIKVEEEASWVGLGWSLNAGGVITRSVRGLDDLGLLGYPFDTAPFPASNGDNNYDWDNAQTNDLLFFESLCEGTKDGEPDQFYFNFGNYSGKFVLRRGSNYNDVKVLLLSQQKIRIEAVAQSTYSPQEGENQYNWLITTPDGFRYFFEVQEITETRSGSGSSEQDADNIVASSNTAPTYTVNSWYLSKIISPTGEQLSFTYDDNPAHRSKSSFSRTQKTSQLVRAQVYCDCNNPNNIPSCGGVPTYFSSQRIIRDVYLERIDFSMGYIEWDTEDRIDMEKSSTSTINPQRLKEIRVFINGYLQKKYAFYYGYFNANTSASDAYDLRLRLDSLQESNGVLEKSVYEFQYITATNLPPKDSKSQDHWGYFNGKNNNNINGYSSTVEPNGNFTLNTLIPAYELAYTTAPVYVPNSPTYTEGWDNNCAAQYCDPASANYDPQTCYTCWTENAYAYLNGADRSADTAKMKAALLKKIIYPTGGSSEFQFEANQFSNFPTQDVWEKKEVIVEDCGTNWSGGCSYSSSASFTLTEPSFVFITHAVYRFCQSCTLPSNQKYATLDLPNPLPNMEFEYADIGLGNTGGSATAYTYHYLNPGTYTLNSFAVDNSYVKMTVSYSHPKLPQEPLLALPGGGSRVKSIKTYNGIDAGSNSITTFDYTKINELGVVRPSGKLMTPISYNYYQLIDNIANQTHVICHTLIQTSSSHLPLGSSAQGSTVGYDQVTVFQGIGGINGKTVYNYFNTEEQVTPYFFPDLPTRIYNSNGLLGMETHYRRKPDGTFQKVSQTENHYNGKKFDDDLKISNALSQTQAIKGLKYYDASCVNPFLYSYPQTKFYDCISEWWRMTKSIQRVYDAEIENRFTETTTLYEYDESVGGSMQRIRQKVTNVQGITYLTEYTFPADYAATGANSWLDSMEKRYMHVYPIEILSKTDQSGTVKVLSGVFNEYERNTTINPSGSPAAAFVPKKTHVLEIAEGITNFSSSVPSGTRDSRYQPRIIFEQYDSRGNLQQVKKEATPPISYLWGYAQALPTAQVLNAAAGEIAYTSFEGDEKGNWTYTGAGISGGKTGSKSFTLTSQTVQRTGLPAGDYVVSFWSDGAGVNISGNSTAAYAVHTDNGGWSLFRYPLTLGANGSVVVTGSGKIDELRLHPADAQMTTYCYDEVLRVQTVSDVNSQSVYYEYDDLGRLIEIKDPDGYIVQQYDYHYKND
ncbi:MAG: RHS repeat domain-containing protein [Bacteroidia bacterium]|nr:RHS repeat domain-containing protein [Bacteroidia bacterium]